MKNILIILILAIGFSSCQSEKEKIIEGNQDIIFSEIYGDTQIQSQFFEINSDRDTTLISQNGTKIRIYKNSFDSVNDSIKILSKIQIEVKEAFQPIDFVLGNLTTTSNGQFLESGGMLFIGAKSNGKELRLKEDKEIGIITPTEELDKSMMIFSGVRDSSKIDWTQPKPILNEQIKTLEESYISITYQYVGDLGDANVRDWLWESSRRVGDKKIFNGIPVEVIAITRNTVALKESGNGLFIPEVITKKGQNGFVEDFNTSYIFRVRKLGWSNIDKFFNDPKAEEVQMIANVNNQEEFGYVFTSLILPERNMYIPGYQKMDNTFGFSHNDSEQLILPIGTEGILMATAYKDEKPYFNFKKFVIGKELDLTFDLSETTKEELKKTLEENI
ncbi:MAG: hypothetical protein R2830_15210 [Saprospiraceae bacterium]